MTDWSSDLPSTPPVGPSPTAGPSTVAPAASTGADPRATVPQSAVAAPAAPARAQGRRRTVLGVILALVAGLSAVTGLAAYWTTDEILSTSTWESTSRAIVNDPVVQKDVAASISRQIVDAVGLEAIVSGLLPGALAGFSGTLTDKATGLLTDTTVLVLRTQFFSDLWQKAVRATHDQFLHSVDGSGGMTTITSRGIELDLGGVVTEVQQQLDDQGIDILDSVDASQIRVTFLLVGAPGLENLRRWVSVLKVLVIVLPAVAVISAIAAFVVARRRWWAVVALGAGGLLGAGLVAIVESAGRERAIDRLSGGVIGRSTATLVIDHIVAGLNGTLLVASAVALTVLVVGIMGVILGVPRRRPGGATAVAA